jgi:uncharacterized protein
MDHIAQMSRRLERKLGNTGLGAIAGVVLFISVTGAASQWNSSTKPVASTNPPVVAPATTLAASPSTTAGAVTTTSALRSGVNGYSAVGFSVTPSGQSASNFCGLLAASTSQQAQGLMGRNDLGGYDAMIFPFQQDTTAAFYMANVPVALSVAWFDKNGKYVSSADMPVCTVAADQCPLFKASGPYRTAIETLKGGLSHIGVGSGSTLSVGSPAPC